MIAVHYDKDKFIEKLVADPRTNMDLRDKDEASAVILAARGGNKKVLDAVLKSKKVNLNLQDNKKRTALMEAVLLPVVVPGFTQSLLGRGAQVNLQDTDGKTALIHAAEQAGVDDVAALLGKSAKRDMRDTNGKTALDYATYREQTAGYPAAASYAKIVQLLKQP
jgi:ankyrin repeat protein